MDPNQTAAQAATEYQKLAQAIESGQSARCLIAQKDGPEQITYVVKGEKIRMETAGVNTSDQPGSMIFDGAYTYVWSDQTKEGFQMAVPEDSPDYEDFGQPDIPDFTDEQELQAYEEEGYSINCNVESVPDSEFTPPTDVNFTDMSQLYNDFTNELTPEQLEQLQQQYGQ